MQPCSTVGAMADGGRAKRIVRAVTPPIILLGVKKVLVRVGLRQPPPVAIEPEAVVVGDPRFEALDVNVDGVVVLGESRRRAGAHDLAQLGIAGERPLDLLGVARRGDPGPDHDPFGGRVAACGALRAIVRLPDGTLVKSSVLPLTPATTSTAPAASAAPKK